MLDGYVWVTFFSEAVEYLCKMAPMAKFESVPFILFQILDKPIGTILRKINSEENMGFEIENVRLFFLLTFKQIKL